MFNTVSSEGTNVIEPKSGAAFDRVFKNPLFTRAPKSVEAPGPTGQSITFNDLIKLKKQVNETLEVIADLILDLQQAIQLINDRIDRYNVKSSHKI